MIEFQPLSLSQISSLQESLLSWFAENQRQLPWRGTSSPFAILVAEKLLQQTAAREFVVQAYLELVDRYPSPDDLARANTEDLEGIVAPLGLKYRATELKRLGQVLAEAHGNSVPNDYETLKQLPGIGEYIARAVLSFAFQDHIAVVDTNVARFLFRVFAIDMPIPANPARKRWLWSLADDLLPHGRSRQFNLAILDLCASLCLPQQPKCDKCPIQVQCAMGRRASQ